MIKTLQENAEDRTMAVRRKAFLRVALSLCLASIGLVWFSVPASAAINTDPPSVVAGAYNTCAIDSVGAAYCWGENAYGEVGNNTTGNVTTPALVSGGYTWRSISVGTNSTCGVTTSDVGYCWGLNMSGVLGTGGSINSEVHVPTLVSGGYSWASIAVDALNACGITTSGDGYCWGENTYGQVGDNTTTTPYAVPTAVSGGYKWSSLDAALRSTCGVTLTGTGYCWGRNTDQQLGDGTTTERHVPTAVSGGYTWSKIDIGYRAACGLTSAGIAYCWGVGTEGQLGDGTATDRATPTAVSGGYTWTYLSMSGGVACGIRTTAAAYCWGDNTYGGLGTGDTTQRNSPTLVSGGRTYVMITTSGVTCATETTGNGYCWGDNTYNQFGNGTSNSSNVPVLIGGSHMWSTGTGGAQQSSTTASAVVASSLVFAVSSHTGTCNGVTQSPGAVKSATAVSLGEVAVGASVTGAQDLAVTTNGSGYTIYLRSTGALTTGSYSVANVSGTNASPSSFPSAGTEGFGYTTSDATLGTGTANRFTNPSANWAAVTTSNAEVSYDTTSSTSCVAYQLGTSAGTRAGVYTMTVLYTAVPVF
jgi:alpha-tubulin suppressor-like RCC1 family protein